MEVTKGRILAARVIAVLADAVQIGLMPLFAGGAATGFDTALDIAVGIAMVALLGWHWAFLPTFALELVPAVDLAPTWTIAVFFVTRKMGGTVIDAKVVPPEPPRLPPAGR